MWRFVSLVFLFAAQSNAQTAIYEIGVGNLLEMQQGIGWPHALHVAVGHEALLQLSKTMSTMQTCIITTPTGISFNVLSPPDNRYEAWGSGCGVRIRNVIANDEGRWRLVASNGTELVGWSEVYVENDTPSYVGPEISLQDGETHTELELTSLDNSYCVVTQPFSESSLIPGHCMVTLDRTTRALQGNWNVLVGLRGQVSELHVQRRVAVEAERLDVGYIHDNVYNKLHLYCNIYNSPKNITFCRFQRTSSPTGYNVMDGLSDGSHSYYGEGFLQKQCGMTIESPTASDYGTWRCSLGVQQWVGGVLTQQAPMQALISVSARAVNSRLSRAYEDEDTTTVFVQENMSFTVRCRSEVSLAYCWFQHPNGSQYTPTNLADEEQLFWYTGESLQTGDCGISFSHSSLEDDGAWTCHMGPSHGLGVELTNVVDVRVTGPLAANRKDVAATLGSTANIYCHTSNGNRPLDYCRFLSPNNIGFNIDSSITSDSPILERFYFTPEKDIDHGDCSVTIDPVTAEDIGEWTCAALINEDVHESRDTVNLAAVTATQSRAGIVGMSVGIAVLVLVLGGFVAYKYGRRYVNFSFRRGHTFSEETPRVSYAVRSEASTDGSTISDEDANMSGTRVVFVQNTPSVR